MKEKCREDFEKRYDDHNIKMALNISTYLDPRFESTFVTMEEEFKGELFLKAHRVVLQGQQRAEHQEDSDSEHQLAGAVAKKKKKSLLFYHLRKEGGWQFNNIRFVHTDNT